MSRIKPGITKFIAVARTLFKAQTAYRFDMAMAAVETLGRVLFARILWGVVFQSRETVGGFTYQRMLAYYVVSSFLVSLETSYSVESELNERIRGGSFSKYMVIPTNPIAHFMARTCGSALYSAMFTSVAAVFGAAAFGARLTGAVEPGAAASAALMIPLGLAFMVCFRFWIGVMAFRFEDAGFFIHLEGSVIQFVTGAMVPLALLPDSVTGALRFLPFHYVTYTPAMLLTGQLSRREGWAGLAILAAWMCVMLPLAQLTYDRARVRYDGVGA
ncbi:MAG: ABC-2 family transporter protein [Oscillospiraceae bacterium]|jgi:ABC-2 type transport system permease protein|nr:ABC-2 family transporter protein [Oscillospiraceae bacterium]